MGDTERQELGITVRDVTPTASAIPTTRPLVIVDTSQRRRHVMTFVDELAPARKAKPDGVMGAEVWVKIDEPASVNPSELTFRVTDTRTPYATDYSGAYANKTAHYMFRWINTRGKKARGAKRQAQLSGRSERP